MSATQPILEFRDVDVEVDAGTDAPYDVPLRGLTFSLAAGELLFARLEREQASHPLIDAAQGLAEPSRGSVHFLGDDWSTVSPWRAAALRGKMGRTFDDKAWLSNLDVDESVALAERHHTRRTPADIRAEAQRWADRFGLASIPETRPGATPWRNLRRAGFVRAFLGSPKLLILDRPMAGGYTDVELSLVIATEEARAGGAADLWLASGSPPRDLRPTIEATIDEHGVQMNAATTATDSSI